MIYHRASKDAPPDETLNSCLGSAVAQISLQLSLQVLNLHQLARHIVKHPERRLITGLTVYLLLCLSCKPDMLVSSSDEKSTAGVKDHGSHCL